MFKNFYVLLILLAVILSILLGGCSSGTEKGSISGNTPAGTPAQPRGTTGTLTMGTREDSGTIPVSTSGGSFTLNEPDSLLNGMVIGVPPNSYAKQLEFKVSYAPIEKHTFGEAFKPITPLISIDNGGGYSDDIMEVKIPVKVPADHFAMGFIYDDKTKTLEGLPTIAQDATSITVGTRHFSWFAISIISDALLKKDIESGFRPGIDDWQFVNRGSFVAPNGHCAGQSITALWYYVTQPDGPGLTLWNRYDNNGQKPATPYIWEDDSYGYRFASTIQKDFNWNSLENKVMTKFIGLNDELTWKAFAYAIQVTGEPQLTYIYSNAGGGHAMVVYRVTNGNLYIADPNYPGNLDRRIVYSNGKFTPYNSGANEEEIKAGNGKAYEKIGYIGKTVTIDWGKIPQRWTELKMGTIGNDIFPRADLTYYDGSSYKNLPDNFTSPYKDVRIASFTGDDVALSAIYQDGKVVSPLAKSHVVSFQPGKNVLGVYTAAEVTVNNVKKIRYVNFQNITINYGGGVSIDPAEMTGKPKTDYTFTAVTDTSSKLAGVSYNWQVNGKQVQSGTNTKLTTQFASAGKYTISVTVIDDKTKQEISSATAQAVIAEAAPTPTPSAATSTKLPVLQGKKFFKGTINAGFTYDKWEPAAGNSTTTSPFISITITNTSGSIPITWNGASFKGSGTSGANTYTLTGTVSADGTTLNNLEFNKEYLAKTADFTTQATTRIILAGPIPIFNPQGLPESDIQGAAVAKYVSSVSYSETVTDNKSGQKLKTIVYRSADWSPEKSRMRFTFTYEP